MSLSEKMTGLMNAVRTMSGTASKLSVDDATTIAGSAGQWGVRVPNLVKNSTSEYKKAPLTSSYKFVQGAVTAGTKYTASISIKNTPIDVKLSVALYDSAWNWDTEIESQAQKDGLLKLTFTPDKNGFAQIAVKPADEKTALSCEYAKAMWNEGDYAPYTSATKPYTVDSLAERLTALENKVGGVVKTLLCALHPVRGCAA